LESVSTDFSGSVIVRQYRFYEQSNRAVVVLPIIAQPPIREGNL
jgi:hypothetical protein